MPRRLISSSRNDIATMTAADLKVSIQASEGRVILCQNYVGHEPLVDGTTNAELSQAFGADMVFFNGYSMDDSLPIPGLQVEEWDDTTASYRPASYRLKDMKKLLDVPLGVYLECGRGDDELTSTGPGQNLIRPDRMASPENLQKVLAEEIPFIVLGGNPGTGTVIEDIIEATRTAKRILGDQVLIMAGKWEDGVHDKVLGDPLAKRPGREICAELIDAGADVICLPMPGSRAGITVDMIRELVEFCHSYKEGTLVMAFLDGSVEGADEDTVRACGLMSKQTGADIHAIGDAGLSGMSVPEDIYALSITTKGRRLTWRRLASSGR